MIKISKSLSKKLFSTHQWSQVCSYSSVIGQSQLGPVFWKRKRKRPFFLGSGSGSGSGGDFWNFIGSGSRSGSALKKKMEAEAIFKKFGKKWKRKRFSQPLGSGSGSVWEFFEGWKRFLKHHTSYWRCPHCAFSDIFQDICLGSCTKIIFSVLAFVKQMQIKSTWSMTWSNATSGVQFKEPLKPFWKLPLKRSYK